MLLMIAMHEVSFIFYAGIPLRVLGRFPKSYTPLNFKSSKKKSKVPNRSEKNQNKLRMQKLI